MREYDKEDDIERLQHIQTAIHGIEDLLLSEKRTGMHERALERYFEIIGNFIKCLIFKIFFFRKQSKYLILRIDN